MPLEWYHWAGGALIVGAAVVKGPEVVATIKSGSQQKGLVVALASKWGPIFGAPLGTIVTISYIESRWRPGSKNTNERAMLRGGAWGLMQQTLDTAKGHAKALASHSNALVKETLKKWDGTGPGLLNPDVNVMFGAYQLGKLTSEFKEFGLVAGAYHQGAAKIRSMLKERKSIPAELPPFGKQYVTEALKRYKELVA